MRTSAGRGQKIFFFFFLLFHLPCYSFDHTHALFDKILKANVYFKGKQAYVDYKSLKTESRQLEEYLQNLSSLGAEEFEKFTTPQKMAFLINAYNAFTVKLILNYYPVTSIKKVGSFLSSPWNFKFFHFLGQKQTLNFIEHDLLRKKFNDPRIHFAIVCASLSCPNLQNFAYRADRLEAQMEHAEKFFLGDQKKNNYHKEKNKLKVSKVFKWFGDDFKKKHGSVENYLIQKFKTQEEPKISYLRYNWLLNDWK